MLAFLMSKLGYKSGKPAMQNGSNVPHKNCILYPNFLFLEIFKEKRSESIQLSADSYK